MPVSISMLKLGAKLISNCKNQNGLISSSIKIPQLVITRAASQLYPSTSKSWDDAMVKAESLVEDAANLSSLHNLIGGEFVSISKYLERLVGTNHPMLETAKRCAYISEGRMGSPQARGLTVLLMAKASENMFRAGVDKSFDYEKLARDQISLAEMTEITYSTYMIHRGVMDLTMLGSEDQGISLNANSENDSIIDEQAKGLHYGNKVSILCGDFLLAHVMRGFGDLFNSKAVQLISSAISKFSEGEFLLIDDWRSKNFMLKEESRDINRWIARSFSSIGMLQANTCQAALVLAKCSERLQEKANKFGKNLAMAWQAHTELQPFLSSQYEPIQLAELGPFPSFDLNSLPVLLFLRNTYISNNKNFNLMLKDVTVSKNQSSTHINLGQHRHQDEINYELLHKMILEQREPIDQTYKVIEGYSKKALEQLEYFPRSQAREALQNICNSLNRRL